MKPILHPTMNVMKKKLFRHIEVKAPNNNFSRCSECNFLEDYISTYPRGFEEWIMFVNDRIRHINYQNACLYLYHGWNSNFVDSATKFLCIIHKKMNYTKCAIPRMQWSTKVASRLRHIPIFIIRMLIHGHGDGAYTHYSIAIWPKDSNLTTSSIC